MNASFFSSKTQPSRKTKQCKINQGLERKDAVLKLESAGGWWFVVAEANYLWSIVALGQNAREPSDTSLVPFTQDSTIDPPCIKWHVAVTEWVCQGGICCQDGICCRDGICWAFQASIHLCVNLGCGRMNLWSGRQLTRDSIKQKEMGLNKFKIGGKCSNLNKKSEICRVFW